MKIAVLIKQVPDPDAELRTEAGDIWIDESSMDYATSEADRYALEAAVRMKESLGGEVVALTLGPDYVRKALPRMILARGADKAVHIRDERSHGIDPVQLAGALSAVVRQEGCEVVLAGVQSDDMGMGQIPILMAEMLDLPHATMVVAIEAADDGLKVRRELEGGWYQDLDIPLHSVLTIQSGINSLRYASTREVLAAKRKPVVDIDSSEVLPAEANSQIDVSRVYAPEQTGTAEMLEGSPAEQAEALVEKLKYSLRVIAS